METAFKNLKPEEALILGVAPSSLQSSFKLLFQDVNKLYADLAAANFKLRELSKAQIASFEASSKIMEGASKQDHGLRQERLRREGLTAFVVPFQPVVHFAMNRPTRRRRSWSARRHSGRFANASSALRYCLRVAHLVDRFATPAGRRIRIAVAHGPSWRSVPGGGWRDEIKEARSIAAWRTCTSPDWKLSVDRIGCGVLESRELLTAIGQRERSQCEVARDFAERIHGLARACVLHSPLPVPMTAASAASQRMFHLDGASIKSLTVDHIYGLPTTQAMLWQSKSTP